MRKEVSVVPLCPKHPHVDKISKKYLSSPRISNHGLVRLVVFHETRDACLTMQCRYTRPSITKPATDVLCGFCPSNSTILAKIIQERFFDQKSPLWSEIFIHSIKLFKESWSREPVQYIYKKATKASYKRKISGTVWDRSLDAAVKWMEKS